MLNRVALQLGEEQCDKYMQQLLESQAEEREMRRQEFWLSCSRKWKKADGKQRDFQAGFLSVLGQFVQSFKK